MQIPVPIEQIVTNNPWLALAGMHDPNDRLIQEWKQEMAAYRQEIEDDPDRPWETGVVEACLDA